MGFFCILNNTIFAPPASFAAESSPVHARPSAHRRPRCRPVPGFLFPVSRLRIQSAFRLLPSAFRQPLPRSCSWALVFFCSAAVAHSQFASPREPVLWPSLDRHQYTLTRAEFESRLPLYSPDGSIRDYLVLDDNGVTVYDSPGHGTPLWQMAWAVPGDKKRNRAHSFKFSRTTLAPWTGVSAEKPLAGLTIALDPGHIGGAWANIEERKLVIGRNPPIQEGDMALIVAQHIAPQLEAAGAKIAWIRDSLEPVTPLRPADLVVEAMQSMATLDARTLTRMTSAKMLRTLELRSELLFYRPAEIGARAARVREYQPDLTLCLHYNAAPWGRFSRPRLYNANKVVIFVHGAYTRGELTDEAQRFHLFRKLLEGTAGEEEAVASSVADSLAEGWRFPPENYDSWNVAAKAGKNPYVWARNLIANRLYDGPTVFVEGPYMNDRKMFPRMLAGDYEGEKEIGGKKVRSIHREYADFVARGVIAHYRRQLGLPDGTPGQPTAVEPAFDDCLLPGHPPTDPSFDMPPPTGNEPGSE